MTATTGGSLHIRGWNMDLPLAGVMVVILPHPPHIHTSMRCPFSAVWSA